MAMDKLLELMARQRASDLFISAGSTLQIKLDGTMVPVNRNRLQPEQVESLLREVVSDKQWERFQEEQELSMGYGLKGVGGFRFSMFRQRGTTAAVVRYIPVDIPAFATLGLPPVLTELILQKRGLILVVGATGCGKTTTLASLIDFRNQNCGGHILTLEDPIEFAFKNKRSIVNQRQIGTDTASLGIALKNALRQAPDCILIGEIRDVETMGAAVAYAQSGHLVLATLHASSASHAMNRIVSFYSPENRRVLLSDLSATLRAVVCQRLLKAVDGGRVPAVEVLLNNTYMAELIDQGRVSEIKEAMSRSMAAGSQTFEESLIKLLTDGRVSRDEALANSDSPTNLLWMMENREHPVQGGQPPGPPGGTFDPPAPQGRQAGGPGEPQAAAQPAPQKEAAKPAGASFSEFLLDI